MSDRSQELELPISNLGTTVTENISTGVETSKATRKGMTGRATTASYADLELALVESQRTNQLLVDKIKSLEANKNSEYSAIEKLADSIGKLTQKTEAIKPLETDNLNRTSNFNAKATVDGRSLVEAQQSLQMFRLERKIPISIPKGMAQKFGPALAISVNGVRVSIPCDGKTYFINETHWEHARERLAKVDAIEFTPDDNIIES